MASPAAAQDDNRTLSVSVGELEYTVKEQPTSKAGKVLGSPPLATYAASR